MCECRSCSYCDGTGVAGAHEDCEQRDGFADTFWATPVPPLWSAAFPAWHSLSAHYETQELHRLVGASGDVLSRAIDGGVPYGPT